MPGAALGDSWGRIDAGAMAKGDRGPGAAAEAGVADLCCTCRMQHSYFQSPLQPIDAYKERPLQMLNAEERMLTQDYVSETNTLHILQVILWGTSDDRPTPSVAHGVKSALPVRDCRLVSMAPSSTDQLQACT